MADTENLAAIKEVVVGAVNSSLGALHEKINAVHVEQKLTNQKVTDHINRTEIHEPVPSACPQSKATQRELDDHKGNHKTVVKEGLEGMIGKAVLATLFGTGVVTAIGVAIWKAVTS